MHKSIIILFVAAIFLFLIGYNFVFNTEKTIDFYNRYSKPSEKALLLKSKMLGNNEIIWMKIAGYGIILFALILFILMLVLICKNPASPSIR
jgi:hypothetical protein